LGDLAIIQAAQTAALLTVAGAIIYALLMLRRELREIREGLTQVREAFRSQKDIEDAIERLWKRIDEIETLQGMRIDFEELTRFKRLIDALEATAKRAQPPEPPP
jgi:flagellar motor component MotA